VCLWRTEPLSVDICSTTSVSSTYGYIRSPNYPASDYSGRHRCLCRLRASSRIIVRLLDLSTATDQDATDADSCPASSADVVRVAAAESSVSRRYCGHLESDRLPETFDTRRADAVVEFLTRGRQRARGFWLAYTSSSTFIHAVFLTDIIRQMLTTVQLQCNKSIYILHE